MGLRLLNNFFDYVKVPKSEPTPDQKLMDMKYVNESMNLFTRPETYRTILKSEYGVNGVTVNTKKKMNKLISEGIVCEDSLSYDRCRERIFFVYEKQYTIIITKTSVYFCNTIIPMKDKTTLTEAYVLEDCDWRYLWNTQINTGEIIKCF